MLKSGFVLLLVQVFAQNFDGNVLILTDATFPEAISTVEYLFLDIYKPTCPYSKRLAPVWEATADTLKDMGSKVVMAKLDGSVNIRTALLQKIRGYPTLDFFHNGEYTRYSGPRTVDALVAFIQSQTAAV